MRKNKKKSNLWKIILILFFVILLFVGTSIISSRNKLVDIEVKDVDYIEIIANKSQVMQTIKNNKEIKEIVYSLNKLRGKKSNRDTSADTINYINVYFNSGKKIEFVKSGQVIRVDNKWYALNRRNSKLIEKIINKYQTID
ncbi:hypothetical protein QP555_02585 [Peptoniphilus lacrimalis]|uniref:hypothetical protein n=1 Tax=Peptoniphilus TaxID=162289 RepID=UPI0001DC9EC7|nr:MULTISPECIES: hypothetical protein [Peptoniphilus]EFK38392.1 hypothetical protein HMPREF9131_0844 [Peptoniphilus sp. oral taxon 836 str. F0141]MDK7721905.1 hypothetical protein [Peptoniphilus lacrimalis]MDK7731507.1 hypothetical protein [Peptoniphilus lacrimalis]MDK8281330.1 hypothetical protein [Peptoniphilus lacrimalis]